jgi:hypothetical protein
MLIAGGEDQLFGMGVSPCIAAVVGATAAVVGVALSARFNGLQGVAKSQIKTSAITIRAIAPVQIAARLCGFPF